MGAEVEREKSVEAAVRVSTMTTLMGQLWVALERLEQRVSVPVVLQPEL